jgi:hypothetical protein
MVSIKVDIEFNTVESQLLEMAANLGHVHFGNDQLKTIVLNAAQRTVSAFTNGVMDAHHRKINPPTPIDEMRRLEQQRSRLNDGIDRVNRQLDDLRSMRLPKVVPPSPKR